MTMTIEDALQELALDDHGIVGEDLARAICEPFGFAPRVPLMTDTRHHFKGAVLPGCTEAGQRTCAIGVLELATQIAEHLNLDRSGARRMLGRGSACRAMVRLIRQHVEAHP